MTDHAYRYRQAAVTYFIYGLIYLTGAFYAASTGMSERASLGGGNITWFILGVLIVLVFPYLIWSGYKWFTRILALLLVIRIIGLSSTLVTQESSTIAAPGGVELPGMYGTGVFLIVAVVTCGMLVRAGWNLGFSSSDTSD